MEKAARLICDVYLWGGAAVLNPTLKKEEIEENSLICSMANGRVNNCYSLKDYVLKTALAYGIWKAQPIGIMPIFEDLKNDIQGVFDPLKRAFNYDVSVEAPGHTWYSEGANLILEKIK